MHPPQGLDPTIEDELNKCFRCVPMHTDAAGTTTHIKKDSACECRGEVAKAANSSVFPRAPAEWSSFVHPGLGTSRPSPTTGDSVSHRNLLFAEAAELVAALLAGAARPRGMELPLRLRRPRRARPPCYVSAGPRLFLLEHIPSLMRLITSHRGRHMCMQSHVV
jgi:hypothetical protein